MQKKQVSVDDVVYVLMIFKNTFINISQICFLFISVSFGIIHKRRHDVVRPLRVYVKMEAEVIDDPLIGKFKHQSCMILSGPSKCGKTTWVFNLLSRPEMFDYIPRRVAWCSKTANEE